jgi:hypothetical protein
MSTITYSNLAIVGLFSFITYSIGLVVYRLYFHPLRNFPGSKICAATLWYDFYYDCVRRGTLIWQIEKLHKQYGKAKYFFLLTPVGQDSYPDLFNAATNQQHQAPSSASAQMSCTSKIAHSTTRSTHPHHASVTNGLGG